MVYQRLFALVVASILGDILYMGCIVYVEQATMRGNIRMDIEAAWRDDEVMGLAWIS